MFLTTWAIASFIMFLLWLHTLNKGNSSVVDLGWSGSFVVSSIVLASQIPSPSYFQLFTLIAQLLWSIRLTSLLFLRIQRGHVDTRYIVLSEKWKIGIHWKYFLFFQAQALSVPFFMLPIFLALSAKSGESFFTVLGFILFITGFSGEILADQQMTAFRKDPKHQDKVCATGLWKYSRHPNYFFESIVWFGFGFLGMAHPLGVFGWLSPLVMLITLLKVTGIPPNEERLLASKGEAYKDYQRKTSQFIPMRPLK